MKKINVTIHGGSTLFVYKSEKGQNLNENEVYTINNEQGLGLLHMSVKRGKSSFKLSYNASGFIPFKRYLSNPMNIEAFVVVLKNILDTIKSIKQSFLRKECLVLDYDMVTVNPLTQQVYFIYLPIQGMDCGDSLREFFLNIIQYTSFGSYEDNSYVKEYISILNSGLNFSEFELEQYINKLYRGQIDSKYKKYILNQQSMPQMAGVNQFRDSPTRDERIYNPMPQAGTYEPGTINNPVYSRPKSGSKTYILGISEPPEKTEFLGASNYQNVKSLYFIRQSTNERVNISKNEFRFGKSNTQSDYCINNNAVSRNHAVFTWVGEKYYIRDLGSTNKTFVSGTEIPPNVDVEIHSGTIVRFANESFEFFES